MGAAEAMPFPPDVQIALLLKVLTYDRSFQYKAKSGVTIGVVYVPTDPESVKAKDEVLKTLARVSDRTIKNLPIKFVPLEYKDAVSLEKAVRANKVNVFYIAPGNAAGLPALLKNLRRTRRCWEIVLQMKEQRRSPRFLPRNSGPPGCRGFF